MSDNLNFEQYNVPIIPEAYKALERQREGVRESKRAQEREVETLKDSLRRDTELGLYDLTRTEKQMRGMPITNVGSGIPTLKFRKRKPRSEFISKCCKKDAFEYRSIHYGGNKPPDRYFRCRGCYNDCEAIPRPAPKKRKKKPRNSRS